ncbi:MAG TPA: tetratricopeptide repeat protein [Anaeromyxobacter sp.]|nr:tetratricopeptide repeat protein [Anaeromyxobacter sp.]
MASSIVEKYEQILAADPRSRIFVELAKALVDRGEHARAVEVCRRGLEHHPSSILGRVIWGRALLEGGDPKGAADQFEIAIALEPSSPYAYNLVGEALLKKGLHRDALPVLARAAELQPGDARVRGWLDEARRRVKGEPQAGALAPAPHAPSPGEATDPGEEQTEPYRPIGQMGPATPPRGAAAALARAGAVDAGAADAPPPAPAASAGGAAPGPAPAGNGAARPPPLPPGATPPPRRKEARGSLLHMIPGETKETAAHAARRPSRAGIPAAHPEADPAEAERIAQQYERELRARLAPTAEPPPSFVDKHRRLLVAGAVALAVGIAGAVYWFVDQRNADLIAQSAAARGRAGLARDTLGSLREANRLLSEARRRRKADAEVVSLSAQVAAVLATEHGDEDARATAKALASDPRAGDGGIAARWLLAGTAGERRTAEAEVLAARPSAAPLLQALAGRILVKRGEAEGGRGRLEIAARATPPLLRALSDLGDLSLATHDADAALAVYGAALTAQPTHARSAVGAAEARLALGRDLEAARRDLAAVDADPASAPPRELRPRFEIAYARVLAAAGDPAAGAARLQKAAESLGESATLAAALAELQLSARAWEKAEAAAARAVRLEPREVSHRVLLARARIGRERYAEALSATDGQDGRAIRIQRAIARFRLGQYAAARDELEKTAKDGKMPAEAAVWYGLVDVATGKVDRALPLLERLAEAQSPPPLAHVALGRALEAAGKPEAAEEAYRTAMGREPASPEGPLALGELLLSRSRPQDAVPALERAARLDPTDLAARRALGEARLLAGKPAAARADLDFVLLRAPRDATALRLLSAAWLAEGQAAEALRAADRALAAAPNHAAVQVAAAKAALAAGDAARARRHAERALKLGASGGLADDARKVLAEAGSAGTGKRR